ncbi:MAG: hypothetical protein ACQEXX_24260 [Bacillota bacterium]
MKRGVIDRFEGEYGVVEINGLIQDILIDELPLVLKPAIALFGIKKGTNGYSMQVRPS